LSSICLEGLMVEKHPVNKKTNNINIGSLVVISMITQIMTKRKY
jgi:hypothetical protein